MDGSFQKFEHGDCPFSQRVLITLKEMGIPFKPVAIAPDAKPGWYYLLHPQNKTPCIYHDGNVVEESGHIVSYLSERFPEANKLASTRHLKLARGTPGYTRFHPHFLRWMSGDESAKKELEAELIRVNESIQEVQKKNEGFPFFGGESFSREDTAIAPMLHNVEVAGRKVKKWSFPKECRALRKYLEEARKVPSFATTVAKDETIVDGYGGLKRRGGEPRWRLADMPE
ncbi:Glutathione S-transferase [Gracilaria domingensis]|nr:Glutathione S-transferase [Gracilaria domingensis]